MQFGSLLAIYIVIWWLCFVAVLPIGNQSQSEAGHVVLGTDPGAPVVPRLWLKLLAATALGAVFTALLLWGISNETLYHYWNR